MKKKSKVSIALLMGCLTFFTAGIASGCNGCNGCGGNKEPASNGIFTLPTETTINAGILYTPDFKLGKDVTVEFGGMKVPASSQTKAEGLSFTPDVLGTYEYYVTFKKGETVWNETIVFNVVDTLAPTIVTKVEDRTTEIGFYTGLIHDAQSVIVQDNCATTLFIKPVSVTFGNDVTLIGEDEDTIFLPVAGDYVVEYSISDFSGNEVKETYTITAQDTVAPVIDASKAMVAWAEGNKTLIPSINIVDVGSTTCQVTAKDSSGNTVAVENGYLKTGTAGKYVVTYVVTDSAGNKSPNFDMTLIVNEKPLINSFTEDGEAKIWNELSRGEDGRMKIMTSDKEVVFTFADNFSMKDWAGYNRFYLTLENERGEEATVQMEVKIDGKWTRVSNDTIGPADFTIENSTASVKKCGFWLADYDVERVEGVRITIASAGGVQVAIDEIGLANETKPTAPTAGSLTGLVSGEMNFKAGEVIVRPITATSFGSNNAVAYKIWASAATDVTIGLNIGGENLYMNSSLKEGWNELFRLPAKESASTDILTKQLTALSVQNKSEYNVSLYFDSFAMTTKGEAELSELVNTTDDYGVIYGEEHSVAWLFNYDARYISNVSIDLIGANGVVKSGLAIGESVTVNDEIASGDYTLKYTFTDPFGAQKTTEIGLCLQKNVLSIELIDEPLYKNSTELFDFNITSEVYTEAELANAVVEKYYRRRGQNAWLDGSEEVSFAKSAWHEFRYIVTYDGLRREKTFTKFVHEKANKLDFEEDSSAGQNCLVGGVYTDSRFLYDGGYYDYRETMTNNRFEISKDWSKSGDSSLASSCISTGWQGVLVKGINALDISPKGINAVSFWLKSEAGYSTNIELGGGVTSNLNGTGASKGWYPSEEFEILPGEHYYTVFLTKTLQDSVASFTILAQGRVGLWFDDIEFKYLNRLEMENVEYANYYDMSNPLVLEKPTLVSDAYTAEELANAKYELSYTVNGGLPVIVRQGADGKFAIQFATAGKIDLTWKVTVNGTGAIASTTLSKTTEFYAGILEINTNIPTYVEFNEPLIFNKPTCQFELSRYEVNYRKEGQDDWTPLAATGDNYEFAPEVAGYYEIQIIGYADVNGTELNGELIKKVYAKDKTTILCFEEDDFLQGGIWYPDSYGTTWHFANLMTKEDGTKWVQFKTTMEAAADGFFWNTPLDLGYDTTMLKLDIESKTTISALKFEIKVDGVSGWTAKEVAIRQGAQTVLVDFGVNIRKLKALTIEVKAGQEFYVDNITVIPPVEVTTSTPALTEGNGAVVEFNAPTSPNVIKNLKVEYQKYGEDTWTTLTANENKYAFTTEENIATYFVRYTMTCDVNGDLIHYEQIDEVIVRDPNVILDFEGADPLRGGESYYPTISNGGDNLTIIKREGSGNWACINNQFDAWGGFYWANGLDLGKTTMKLQVKVYAPKAINNLLVEFKPSTGGWPEISVNIPQGESTIILDFTSLGKDMNGMKALIFRTDRTYDSIFLDNIAFVTE